MTVLAVPAGGFVVEPVEAARTGWDIEAGLVLVVAERRRMMNAPARARWEAGIDAQVAEAARIAEHGARVAVFVESSSAEPYEPAAAAVMGAFDRAGVLARCTVVRSGDTISTGLPEGVAAWRSPHNPPLRADSTQIVIGGVGSRARQYGPRERRERGMACEFSMSAEMWHLCTGETWWAPPGDWTDAGIAYDAARRLVALHTYDGETVAVLAPSLAAASAAVQLGRGCVVAAGSAPQAQRIAAGLAELTSTGGADAGEAGAL